MRTPLSGFTLIEILVVMTILAAITVLAVPVSLNLVRTYTLQNDRDILSSLIERARNQSLANIHQLPHGVAIQGNNYIGYEGTSYAARDASQDLVYPKSSSIVISGPTEITFQPLTAATNDTTFTLQTNAVTKVITINQEGYVDW